MMLLDIPYGCSYSNTVTWDGTAGDNNYTNLQSDNIMAIAVVFEQNGTLRYSDPPSGQSLLCLFCPDNSAASTPGVVGTDDR